MSQNGQTHFKNLTKNDEPLYSKNAQLKILNLE